MPNNDSCNTVGVVRKSDKGKDASLWFELNVHLHPQAYTELVYKSVTALGLLDKCV